MEELSVSEVNAVSGGNDGVVIAAGVAVGVVAGALVLRGGFGIFVGAALGGAIFYGSNYLLRAMAR